MGISLMGDLKILGCCISRTYVWNMDDFIISLWDNKTFDSLQSVSSLITLDMEN